MSRSSSSPLGGTLLLGLLVGLLAWWIFTKFPQATHTINPAALGDPNAVGSVPAVGSCTTAVLPDIVLPYGPSIPGGTTQVCLG